MLNVSDAIHIEEGVEKEREGEGGKESEEEGAKEVEEERELNSHNFQLMCVNCVRKRRIHA